MVLDTKYRRHVFDAARLRHLETVFGEVCADFEVELVEFNGETDHVHLHVNYPPTVAVSNLVNSLKAVSARIMRRDHPDLAPRYWHGHLSSPSYVAGSLGGPPMNMLRHYIDNQQQPVEAPPRTPIPSRPEGPGLSARDTR